MRILELFAGIGGVAAAAKQTPDPRIEVVQALGINQDAAEVYAANFPTPYAVAELESYSEAKLAAADADLWWLSPPCLPFTVRGKQRDVLDPRNAALLRLVDCLSRIRPRAVTIENVPGFANSLTRGLIQRRLRDAGYAVELIDVCPSDLGWPNRRRRVYLTAWRAKEGFGIPPQFSFRVHATPLNSLLDHGEIDDRYYVDGSVVAKYEGAMDRVDSADSEAVTACFAASYGKTHIRAGSYLCTSRGQRRFTPREVARLLGFDDEFHLPQSRNDRVLWRLLGDSLAIRVVSDLLTALRHHLDGAATLKGPSAAACNSPAA